MNKKDITEIKRRFTKEGASFSRLTGCYVNSNKEKILNFRDTFLNLSDEEIFRYLEIAKKCMSGKLMNNLLDLEFTQTAEEEDGPQGKLLKILKSGLDDDDILNEFYDSIIMSYDKPDNYLILLYKDAYDIPLKTKDNIALDDSVDVYEYIICAICPVDLSKQVLGFDEDDSRFEALKRDWVVGLPESAFTFPCFSERASDIHHCLIYTKDTKSPHTELWEDVLGLKSEFTSAQKCSLFTDMVASTAPGDEDEKMDTVLTVQKNISDFVTLEKQKKEDNEEAITLSGDDAASILEDSGFSEDDAKLISEKYDEYFENSLPQAEELIDSHIMKNGELKLEKKALQNKVVELNRQMEEAGLKTNDALPPILLRVPDQSREDVMTTFIDGKRCLVIPINDIDEAVINGEKIDLE